ANLYHSNAASTITNAGTLAKTGGTGTTTIDNLLVNSGTLKIASGAINLTGGFTNTGTISSVAGTTLELSHDGDIAGTLALD
ncbi:hypothetical protein, partial [Enterococcus faecalis]|uniref:hypothetical protein n=1 Tax=Enterococcus faecalis TaxID=1351 RepID=UPI00403F70BB